VSHEVPESGDRTMWSFQLKEKWRELSCSKRLCCGWLPKVDLVPRTLLAQITVPIEISYRDCAAERHSARLKTKAPRSTITKHRGPQAGGVEHSSLQTASQNDRQVWGGIDYSRSVATGGSTRVATGKRRSGA